jgi:hypothetical protein
MSLKLQKDPSENYSVPNLKNKTPISHQTPPKKLTINNFKTSDRLKIPENKKRKENLQYF